MDGDLLTKTIRYSCYRQETVMAKKRYFEDFAVGEVIKSRSHTVTEEEMRCYIKATDSAHPLHDDPEYCRAKGLKGIIIHGSMVLGLVDGFFAHYVCPEDVRTLHYGYDKVRWTGTVYPGDTINSVFELTKMEERDQDFGVLTFDVHTYNQRNELVLYTIDKLHVERRKGN